MRRTLCTALMTATVLLAGCASSTTDGDLASFCHGYIQKGLGEYPIEGVDRNAMWLSWNEVVPTTLIADEMDQNSFDSGREVFADQLAANDVAAIQYTMGNDCDQGENPLWLWW